MTLCLTSYGQISTYQDQIQYELTKRGISIEEFNELLIDSGIDPNALDQLTAEETAEIQQLIQDFERDRFLRERVLLQSDTSDLFSPDDLMTSDSSLNTIDTPVVNLDTITEAIYGHKQFKTGQISVIKTEEGFSPPENYVLGPGDQIVVSIFGNSQVEDNLTVGADGSVRFLTGNVKTTIGGSTVQEARIRLERAYKEYYRFSPNQFSVYVSALRQIRVQIYGEVMTPGGYTVSAANGVTNLIAAAGGFKENGSVRNIKLIKSNNDVLIFDLYKLLTEPGYRKDFGLENGDNIIVPSAEIVVSIDGAVHRPLNYEMIAGEGLFDLIEYAGGLSKGAYLRSMKIRRYENDRKVIKDVPYAEIIKSNNDFALSHGDEVEVQEILDELENYVSVIGEVRNEGNFELTEGMTLADVIAYAGVKSSTKMDLANLKRINKSGNVSMIKVSLEDARNGVGPSALIMMQDRDELTIWAKERFIDNKYIIVAGAVRVPEQFDYDDGGTIRALDLINLAGGLSNNAANYAMLHRLNPLNPNNREYITLPLNRMVNDPTIAENVFLEPYDSLYVYSADESQEDVFIKVAGAVNSPGEFLFGDNMTLKNAILMANGFKRSSATNRIEISRVIIEDNQPTKTIIKHVSLDRNDLNSTASDDFVLEPYDNVFVRYVPSFELQQNVYIKGEVTLPGEYSLTKDNETVLDIIERAGGLTQEAFPAAATLYRSRDSLGYMVMKLDDVIKNPRSSYNQSLTHGDTIQIPKLYNHVIIKGATQFLQESNQKQIVVPFEHGKDALFYINDYAGGFADNARRDKIFVKYPNNEVKTVKKRFLLGKKYPEVLPGSEITVWTLKRDLRNDKKEEDVNWTKVLGDSVAQAMSILTLILLVQRLD